MTRVGISNPYSWITPNRPISLVSPIVHALETTQETARYKYVNTFGSPLEGTKKSPQEKEIPAEVIRAYIKELLAARKETERHENRKSEVEL